MKRENKFIVAFITVYVITLMCVLMFFSKDIDTTLLITGFGSVAGIFGAMLGYFKWQSRKKRQ